jgi:hypothetical protein
MASIEQLKSLISSKGGVARPNVFRVLLPSIPGATSSEVNLLCKDVQLPGRQIMTSERQIGMKLEKMPYGYAVTDLSMTFHVLNDYGIRQYFEAWQNLAVDQTTYEIGYQSDYSFDITIQQLKKGFSMPIYSTPLGLPKLPTMLQNRLPKIGPIDLAQGQLDLDYVTSDHVIYSCTLIDAFPTSLNAIALGNDQEGIAELNVQLSYTNWKSSVTQSNSTNDFIDVLKGTALTNLARFIN